MIDKPVIFYADDDEDDRTWIKECFLFKMPDAEVREFENGAQLMGYLSANDVRPNLIVLDINMPVMSGKEVLLELRKNIKWESLKVILFTNSTSDVDRRFASDHRAEFVTKPMSYDGIIQTTEKFIQVVNSRI